MDALDIQISQAQALREETWRRQRIGKLTASRFGDVMQKGKPGKFGTKCVAYMHEKIAELRSGQAHTFYSRPTEWGKLYEPHAKEEYQEETGNKVITIGYCPINEYAGATPDGLIGTDGVLECKSPFNPSEHVKTLLDDYIKPDYLWQIQGQLLATNRQWCDFVSYDPRTPSLKIIRVERDENKIKALTDRLKEVWGEITRLKQKLK